MILLKPDYLILQTSTGEQIPCSPEWVSLQLAGDKNLSADPEMLQNISAAVLHYFKNELQRDSITMEEFAIALEKVLRGLGVKVDMGSSSNPVVDADLDTLARQSGEAWELFFYSGLREEVKRMLGSSPRILRFRGLRTCAQHLASSPKWNHRCQVLNDQILEYLRTCWKMESTNQSCALVVM